MFEFLREDGSDPECRCRPAVADGTLRIDATECPAGGALETHPACRTTAIEALERWDVSALQVENSGVVRHYSGRGLDLLEAAAAFARRVETRDSRLSRLARRDPLRAANEAAGRAGLVADLVTESGLDAFLPDRRTGSPDDGDGDPARDGSAYEPLVQPLVSPTLTAATIDPLPPPEGELRTRYVTDTGATVRIYETAGDRPSYHVEPIEYALDPATYETLEAARNRLVRENVRSEDRSAHDAVDEVAASDEPVDTLARILKKHTTGYGILEDLFSDESVSDVFVNAPTDYSGLHVRVAGAAMETNVRLSDRGRARLASKIRTESGRAFSRADPTVDALLTDVAGSRSIRVAGVRAPASDGLAFALRAEGTDVWRLDRLVRLRTISPAAAGFLSMAMKRGTAVLVAGPRGAGKTTLASALLWELPPATRILTIEDTPELPVTALQSAGRDAQRLRASTRSEIDLDPATALHTALRLGDGALAVGEVRGEEAAVLYEAMRVGAASDTVLGTIHGEGYDGVRERVVSDLGVPASSFAITDLLVTLAPVDGTRRVVRIEEVTEDGAATLFEFTGDGLETGPRMERGNSEAVATMTPPGETYSATMAAIQNRTSELSRNEMATSMPTEIDGTAAVTAETPGSGWAH